MGTAQQLLIGGQGAAPATDPFFANVQWLTHFDNPSGVNSDIPVVGPTLPYTQCIDSTTQVKFGSKSLETTGTNALLTSTTWPAPGSGDWAFEGWIYFKALRTAAILAMGNTSSETGRFQWGAGSGTNGVTNLYMSAGLGSGSITSAAGVLVTGQWQFLQLIKSSGTIKIGVNGVQVGSSLADSNNFTNTNFYFLKDNYSGDNSAISAYVDDWRYTRGAARTIGLPTAPFPDA